MKTYRFSGLPLFLALGLTMGACTDNFKDYNTNPNEATEEMLSYDNLLVGGFVPQMQMDVIPVSDKGANDYQRAQCLTGDIFSGYMAAIGVWNGSSNNSTYNLSFGGWNDAAFSVGFTKVMPAWKQIHDKAEEVTPTTYALAQVLKVATMHRLTDNYGPLPYFNFGHGGLTTPYDSQEEIYKSFFKDLDAAIEVLEDFAIKNPAARPLRKFDLVYGGDYGKWVKFANSLKLRLAMRISYVEPELARRYAEEAVNHSRGVFTQNTDNALLQSANGIIVYNPLKVVWDAYSDTRMGANMESFLKGYGDARLSKYFNASKKDGEYHGVRTGIVIGDKSKYEPLSTPNIEANKPVQWMVAAEVYFLRAEGALRGWDMGDTAEELYNQGIRTSHAQWDAVLPGAYLKDEASVAASYEDPVASNHIRTGDNRLSTITIKWNNSDSFEKNLERIITQKWLSVYPDGQEAWSEFRRTGYPKIFPVAVNNSGGTISTEKQIRRIPFPISEYNNNKAEVRKAVSLLNGPDNGGTNL
ncbi:MAG: RagB/SusD family nutrient uptake outer membrane protein, partial [Bacteroidales bacterium]